MPESVKLTQRTLAHGHGLSGNGRWIGWRDTRAGAGGGRAGKGRPMNPLYAIGLVVAGVLLVYLSIALLKPEWFS